MLSQTSHKKYDMTKTTTIYFAILKAINIARGHTFVS